MHQMIVIDCLLSEFYNFLASRVTGPQYNHYDCPDAMSGAGEQLPEWETPFLGTRLHCTGQNTSNIDALALAAETRAECEEKTRMQAAVDVVENGNVFVTTPQAAATAYLLPQSNATISVKDISLHSLSAALKSNNYLFQTRSEASSLTDFSAILSHGFKIDAATALPAIEQCISVL